jgi:hypothetical protein
VDVVVLILSYEHVLPLKKFLFRPANSIQISLPELHAFFIAVFLKCNNEHPDMSISLNLTVNLD